MLTVPVYYDLVSSNKITIVFKDFWDETEDIKTGWLGRIEDPLEDLLIVREDGETDFTLYQDFDEELFVWYMQRFGFEMLRNSAITEQAVPLAA